MGIYFILVRPDMTMIAELPILLRFIVDTATGALLYMATVLSLWKISGKPSGVEETILTMIKNFRGSQNQQTT